MKNEFDTNRMLNPEILFDISEIPESDLMFDSQLTEIARKYKKIVENNQYGISWFAVSFDGPPGYDGIKYVSIETLVNPKDILAYLKFERELQNQGYKVHFSRESRFA